VAALALLVLVAACANLASLFAGARGSSGNWRSVSLWEQPVAVGAATVNSRR